MSLPHKACLALKEGRAGESGVRLRPTAQCSEPPAALLELQQLLLLACEQVIEVQEMRCRMPTLPPKEADPEGVSAAERSLRALRKA